LVLYVICILLAFILSTVYNATILGVLISFMGMLIVVGFIGGVRRDHPLVCFYIAIIAIELVLGLIATVLWLMTVVVLYVNAESSPQAIDAVVDYSPLALALAVVLVLVNPFLVLLNIYSLSLAAQLKRLLYTEKITKERDMVRSLLQQQLHSPKPSRSKRLGKSTKVKDNTSEFRVLPVSSGGGTASQ